MKAAGLSIVAGKPSFSNVLLDFPFALPMIDARVALRSTNGTVNEVFHAGFFCCVRQILALLNLTLRSDRPEILNAIDTVDAARGRLQRYRLFQISLHHFDPHAN